MKKSFAKYELTVVKEGKVPYEFEQTVNAPSVCFEIAKSLGLCNKAEEEMHLVCLDTKNFPISEYLVSKGSLNSSIVHPREVFKRALLSNACSIMVIHNHPSGNPTPSSIDFEITNRLAECGKILGITLLDHMVVGDDTFYSLREHGDM